MIGVMCMIDRYGVISEYSNSMIDRYGVIFSAPLPHT